MARSLATLQRRSGVKPPVGIIYGTRGVGKTTLAAGAPSPVLMAIENGVGLLDVPNWADVTCFSDVMEAIASLYSEDHDRKTLVVDSLDWLEPLVWQEACARNGWQSIDTPGYGKGYVAATNIWREYLDGIRALNNERGMTIIQVAHEHIKRFDSPETDPYDRYQIKLHDRASALVQEDADFVAFMTYRVSTKETKVGFDQKVTRALGGGNRVIYTEERPAYLAKNRLGLPHAIDLPTTKNAWERPEELWAAFIKYLPEGAPVISASGTPTPHGIITPSGKPTPSGKE